MRVTVRQLKALIREAAAEAVDEMNQLEGDHGDPDEGGYGMEEDTIQEAVTKAFRAGYQRGVKAATTRKVRR